MLRQLAHLILIGKVMERVDTGQDTVTEPCNDNTILLKLIALSRPSDSSVNETSTYKSCPDIYEVY